MLRVLLISIENGRSVKTYVVNYNISYNMKSILFCFILSFSFSWVLADLEFYPGFRRPDPVIKWDKDESAEEYALEQLTAYLEQLQLQRPPPFSWRPTTHLNTDDDFAIAPPDPRYYQPAPEDYDFLENDENEEKEEEIKQPAEREVEQKTKEKTTQKTENKIHKAEDVVVKSRSEEATFPFSNLQELNRYLKETHGGGRGKGDRGESFSNVDNVASEPALQDDTAGVYIIAVVAGISAAATVGLIAFAIGWYNLQKNAKNAGDVSYPAYGVTGPQTHKDAVSPTTGDRRLAHSAQMYHYQHQKQQIIAMESRAGATVRHGSMSEAESDEENEEGDYTVYECPGLAPTGEMEVKNPMFQDDPTPATQPSSKNEESLPDQK